MAVATISYYAVKPHLTYCSIIDTRPFIVLHSARPHQIQFILQASGHTMLYTIMERGNQPWKCK